MFTEAPDQPVVLQGTVAASDVATGDGDGVFANISPCEPLLATVTANPDANSRMGNFTEAPTVELIKECSRSHSAYVLNGEALAEALQQPSPLVKVLPAGLLACTL